MRDEPAEILVSACCQNPRDSFFFGIHAGVGVRKKMANKQYEHFWRHNDDDGSDDDTILP